MRSLRVLLILLALLSLSTAIKCYVGAEGNQVDGSPVLAAPKRPVMCPQAVKICGYGHIQMESQLGKFTAVSWSCGPAGDENKMTACEIYPVEVRGPNGIITTTSTGCACTSDLCNADRPNARTNTQPKRIVDGQGRPIDGAPQIPLPALPSSPSSVQCYVGMSTLVDGQIPRGVNPGLNTKKVQTCEGDYCAHTESHKIYEGKRVDVEQFMCIPDVDKETCVDKDYETPIGTLPTKVCVCKGSLCNDSKPTQTAPGPQTFHSENQYGTDSGRVNGPVRQNNIPASAGKPAAKSTDSNVDFQSANPASSVPSLVLLPLAAVAAMIAARI